MDAFRQIHHIIHIDTSVNDVWTVFVNPAITKQLGGEYLTNWKQGSSIHWKDNSGVLQTSGIILELIPQKLLKIQLYDTTVPSEILSTVTYEFEDHHSFTRLVVEEVIHYQINNDEYHDASQRWKDTLFAIAELAEKIRQQ